MCEINKSGHNYRVIAPGHIYDLCILFCKHIANNVICIGIIVYKYTCIHMQRTLAVGLWGSNIAIPSLYYELYGILFVTVGKRVETQTTTYSSNTYTATSIVMLL